MVWPLQSNVPVAKRCKAGPPAAEATVYEGELEQGAGEGSLRRDSDDAAPARHVSRTQSRPNGRVRTCSSRSRKEPQKGGGFGTPAATNLNLFASASGVLMPGQGYLREPATPAGWGLFAGCPRATHPTAPLGRQMGRWAL